MTRTTGLWRQAQLAIAGGILFAVGNALHPIDHSEASQTAPTWVAAHLVFSAGAILMAAGLPAIVRRLRSRFAAVAAVIWGAGLVWIPASGYYEAFAAPQIDPATEVQVMAAAGTVDAAFGLAFIAGALLFGLAGLRSRGLARACAVVLAAASAALLALPEPPGSVIIAATVAQGLAVAGLGAWSLHLDPRIRHESEVQHEHAHDGARAAGM